MDTQVNIFKKKRHMSVTLQTCSLGVKAQAVRMVIEAGFDIKEPPARCLWRGFSGNAVTVMPAFVTAQSRVPLIATVDQNAYL